MDQRICIKFCVKNEIKCIKVCEMLRKAYGESTMSKTRVYSWYKRFQEGREDVEDDERPGRPSTSKTNKIVEKVKEMIMNQPRITIREVADTIGISIGSCHEIFSNILKMKRVTTKFVPQDFEQENITQELGDANNDPELLKRIKTVDETWLHGYDIETRTPSSRWKWPEELRLKNSYQNLRNMKDKDQTIPSFPEVINNEEDIKPDITADSDGIQHMDSQLQPQVERLTETLKSSQTEDEFDIYAKHIAIQLRRLPLDIALVCQNDIQQVITKARLQVLKDETDVFKSVGSYVSNKLRSMTSSQQIVAKNLVLKVIYKGYTNKLSEYTDLYDRNFDGSEHMMSDEEDSLAFNDVTNTFTNINNSNQDLIDKNTTPVQSNNTSFHTAFDLSPCAVSVQDTSNNRKRRKTRNIKNSYTLTTSEEIDQQEKLNFQEMASLSPVFVSTNHIEAESCNKNELQQKVKCVSQASHEYRTRKKPGTIKTNEGAPNNLNIAKVEGSVGTKSLSLTANAIRVRRHREKKRAGKPPKVPKTALQRLREHRQRKKWLRESGILSKVILQNTVGSSAQAKKLNEDSLSIPTAEEIDEQKVTRFSSVFVPSFDPVKSDSENQSEYELSEESVIEPHFQCTIKEEPIDITQAHTQHQL